MIPQRLTNLLLLLVAAGLDTGVGATPDHPLKPIPYYQVDMTSDFWRPRMVTQRKTLIPWAFQRTESGVAHLQAAADKLKGKDVKHHRAHRFIDSDLYKVMDGAAYLLQLRRDLFERGNAGRVQRPVEGFVFHYPCYFAAPLSVIRLGNYKLMEHIRTGEMKLCNVAKDYQEKNNLIEFESEKASELRSVMHEYLASIDAEDVEDVYEARFAELDRFEKGANEVYEKTVAKANGDEEIIAKAKEKLAKDLARFESNRKKCREKMLETKF